MSIAFDVELDTCGLNCPLPILKAKKALTAMQAGQVLTSGGRVLCVVALGDMVKMAQKRAYEIADTIHFEGAQMRRDIGWRAIGRR